MLLSILAVTFSAKTQKVYIGIISYAIGILFVVKMIYQLKLVISIPFYTECNKTVKDLLTPIKEILTFNLKKCF